MEKVASKIMIYSRHLDGIGEILEELNKNYIDVTIESCDKCLMELDICIFDTLQETRPDVVLIDNDGTNNGILLYKMIKDEGTLENIPVLFLGEGSEEDKLQSLKLGALDYIYKPFNKEEVLAKIKNYIEIGRKYVNGSIYDNMTGIYVRNFGEEIARKEFKSAKQYKQDFTTLVIDIDNMAKINYYLGKEAGDKLIKEVINIVRNYLTHDDFVYRHSGQKFVMVFINKNGSSVYKICEDMMKDINSLYQNYDVHISFTGSITSAGREQKDFNELLVKGFKTLEKGKLNGKGKIYLNEESIFSKAAKNILILDDDNVISNILSSRYRNKGYAVFTAEDLDGAREIIMEEDIDAVITDYIIPGVTGIELVKELKDVKNNLKLIVLSSQRNERIIESALRSGADDYLVKPFSPIELDSRLLRLIT